MAGEAGLADSGDGWYSLVPYNFGYVLYYTGSADLVIGDSHIGDVVGAHAFEMCDAWLVIFLLDPNSDSMPSLPVVTWDAGLIWPPPSYPGFAIDTEEMSDVLADEPYVRADMACVVCEALFDVDYVAVTACEKDCVWYLWTHIDEVSSVK